MTTTSWKPSRKIMAALFSGLFLIASHAFASSGWDATEWGELMALLGPLSVAYWTPDVTTPPAPAFLESTPRRTRGG